MTVVSTPTTGALHLRNLAAGLDVLHGQLGRLERWADELASVLGGGGRLLAAGNGGSAAQAQHLTSELVGRYCRDRRAFSALSLHSDTSSLTAIGNDYGAEEIFARQVRAHGRPGDLFLALSTSGRSPNVLAAARAAHDVGMRSWALTGPGPNRLSAMVDDALRLDVEGTPAVQELHLVAVHVLCELFDERVA